MTRRYYCSELPGSGKLVALNESESQHALKVMRVRVGDEVQLFDGKGNQADAIVATLSRKECQLKVGDIEAVDREPQRGVNFAIALPKPDRCRELIERLTELGVRQVVPIVAERTQRGPSASQIEKLRRAVIEACKQSQRNVLMTIADPVSLREFLQQPSAATLQWIAHPDGEPISEISTDRSTAASLLVGPEGGWTDDEVQQSVEANYQKVGLGKRIYRVETAAVFLASKLIDG